MLSSHSKVVIGSGPRPHYSPSINNIDSDLEYVMLLAEVLLRLWFEEQSILQPNVNTARLV